MKFLPQIAALLTLMLLSATAQAQDPVIHGRALVKEFCGECHAIGKTGKSPHADATPLRMMGRTFDLDDFPRVLIRGISSDHPDMPQVKFNPQDARDVRDYLRTIQE
jgi:cytochrome c